MQVRKSLQNPKSRRNKNSFAQYSILHQEQKKGQKTIRQEKIKNKMRYKHTPNKSKQKLSSTKVKKKDKSPTIYTERIQRKKSEKRRSPLNWRDTNNKITISHRDFDKQGHSISTKLNTERTPMKKYKQEILKTKPTSNKKKKISTSTKKTYSKKDNVKKSKNSLQGLNHSQSVGEQQYNAFKKKKKIPLQINTNCPKRKQSYFDSQILYKLNRDKYEFVQERKSHEKSLKIAKHIDTQIDKLANKQSIITTSNFYKQCGAITQENDINPPVSYRDLEYFRKEQQLKWKIIYLELSNLKENLPTPEKIQSIIEESDKNISEFQIKCKQLCNSNLNNHYIFESPTKIRNALQQRNRKSSQQNIELLKSLSDEKLKQELQKSQNFNHIQGFNPNSFTREKKEQGNSFSKQLKNQLEQYPQPQTHVVPQLQLEKTTEIQNTESQNTESQNTESQNTEIYNAVQQNILVQFCEELVESQNIFHAFLIKTRKQAIEYPEYKIECYMQYSLHLFHRLLNYIHTQNLVSIILERVNIPFGNSPLQNLKYLRNNLIQDEQQTLADEDDVFIQPVLDSDMLVKFECQASEIPQEGQYFYNHAVYSCVNQILDTLRPFGEAGLPPLQKQSNILVKCTCIQKLYERVRQKLEQILCIRIGRTQFAESQPEPVKIAEKAYKLLDHFLVIEEEQKFKKIQDSICEQKYILSQSIIQYIINEELLLIYNEFL